MISVIIPLFNYAHYIGDCINSVLKQSYDDFEAIIVDDCSTDDSYNKAQDFVTISPERIKVYRLDKNAGYSAAKNYGIIKSRGEFIAHIDADDMLTTTSLEDRLSSLKSNPSSLWCHGRALCFSIRKEDADLEEDLYGRWRGIKKGKWPKENAWKAIHAQTVMVRRSLYTTIGLYDENMRCSADREMWRRILNQDLWPSFVDTPVCWYRYHKKQMHKSKFKLKHKDDINAYMDKISKIRKSGINENNTRMLQK